MNATKVFCLSLLAVSALSLFGGATIAEQAWPSTFLDQATRILGYLIPAHKRNPAGLRISYAARCNAVRGAPLIPPIRLQKALRSSTMLEAARSVVRDDRNTLVSSDRLDNVRIEIGDVPDSLLRTNIATLRLNGIEQHNPIDAIAAIEATKEVQRAAVALHLKSVPVVLVQLLRQPTPGAPRIPSVSGGLG